jgi:thiamine-monophosphate kinase
MAARPVGVLIALSLPPSWRDAIDALADGLGAAARAAGAAIVGGDLTSGRELSITVTVLGAAARPLGRDGARAGDAVWVTGRLGGPLRALRAFERGEPPTPADRARFARPVARLDEARWLAERGATALVDVSDGLAADLRHLAAASGVSLTIDPATLPRVPGATESDALASGEEYELALTAGASLDADAFAARFGVALTRIGHAHARAATDGALLHVSRTEGGARVDLPNGHDHFSS